MFTKSSLGCTTSSISKACLDIVLLILLKQFQFVFSMSVTSVWSEEIVKKNVPAFVKASTNNKNSRGLEWLNPLTWFQQNDSAIPTVSVF